MRLSDSEWKIADCLWNNGDMTITELTKELLEGIIMAAIMTVLQIFLSFQLYAVSE